MVVDDPRSDVAPSETTAPEVLPALDLDDHRRARPERLVALPAEELAAVAFERDLNELHRQLVYLALNEECGMRKYSRRTGRAASAAAASPFRIPHSVYAPMCRNFSRRRRTSFSGL